MSALMQWLNAIFLTERDSRQAIEELSHRVSALTRHIIRLEKLMSAQSDQLDAVGAALDAIAADVQILVDRPTGDDPEVQAAIDRLSAKVGALQTQVGDQDGSDNPPADPQV